MIKNLFKKNRLGKSATKFNIERLVKGGISPYDNYCDGYGSPGASGKNYILGLVLGAGVAKLDLHHDGSQVLDETKAFDRAEVASTNLGQINMSIVSSFCGLSGVIWGYDIVPAEKLRIVHELGIDFESNNGEQIPVYSARPITDATKKLYGTIKKKRFPLLPGAHVPCAGKNFKDKGPRHIYAGIAIGIAKDRSSNASLLMEDLGWLPLRQDKNSLDKYKKLVLKNLARSVIEVGFNQNIDFKEIFVEMTDVVVPEGHVGCALVAAPYFTLARRAIPRAGLSKFLKMGLKEWDSAV